MACSWCLSYTTVREWRRKSGPCSSSGGARSYLSGPACGRQTVPSPRPISGGGPGKRLWSDTRGQRSNSYLTDGGAIVVLGELDDGARSVVREYIAALTDWLNFEGGTRDPQRYEAFRELIRNIIRLQRWVDEAIFGSHDYRELGPVRQQANSIANDVREEQGLGRFGRERETRNRRFRPSVADQNTVYPEPGDAIERPRDLSELEDAEIVEVSLKVFGSEIKVLRQIADRRSISVTDALRQSILTQNWFDKEVGQGWAVVLEKASEKRRRVVFR
jgi:hypothetical protein